MDILAILMPFIEQYGYAGFAIILFASCVGLPISTEVLLPLGGVLARTGKIDLTIFIVMAVTVQIVGFTLAYLMARYGGLEVLERYGRYVGLRRRHLVSLQRLFKRHGSGLVLVGVCLPGLHGCVAFPAGLAGMPLLKFMVMISAGVLVWTTGLVALGWYLGGHLDILGAAGTGLGAVGTVILLLVGGAIWYSKHHAKGEK